MRCPCCDSEVPEVKLEGLTYVMLGPVSGAILRVLTGIYPRGMQIETLIEAVYGAKEPENAMLSLRVRLKRLRERLEPYGWTITGGRGMGRPSHHLDAPFYRLTPLQAPAKDA